MLFFLNSFFILDIPLFIRRKLLPNLYLRPSYIQNLCCGFRDSFYLDINDITLVSMLSVIVYTLLESGVIAVMEASTYFLLLVAFRTELG